MNKISSNLRSIASKIDKTVQSGSVVSASRVAADIKSVISSMEREARVARYASIITAAVTIEKEDNPAWKTVHGERFVKALDEVSKADKDELYDAVRNVFRTAERFCRDLDQ